MAFLTRTDSLNVELPAAETRSRLDAILNLSNDGILIVSFEGTILGWNRAAEEIYGYTAEEIVGKPLATLVPADRLHELSSIYRGVARGGVIHHFETVRIRRDEVPIDVSLSIMPIRDMRNRVTSALVITRDITSTQLALREAVESSEKLSDRERMLKRALVALRESHEKGKETQLQLVQAAKLESIGRLAAGVAHEVKNPLAVILFAVDYLAEAIPSPDENMTAALTDAREAVARADSVIRGLLDFSTATDLSPAEEDVNALLRRSLHLVGHSLTRSHVFAVEEMEEGLPYSMLDRNKLEQVFVNLMINAIDAMPDGGTLVVRTRRDRLTQVGTDVGVRMTDPFQVGQSVIVVEIEDTGTGIDETARPRLFDPFFTTKPPGKGTGLGLAVCKTIVALHGGTIRLGNKQGGGGARATVVLHGIRSKEGNGDGEAADIAR
ncbi:MAG TPA: ATP-binding protein [Candidatus Dormibacteraeota bacterium]|nr:ATP-binding protein [Candidatus Dormibacteraeota bacterium]